MEVDHRVGRANTQVISRQAADAKPADKGAAKVVRADHDYAIAWCRPWGQGRVFFCSFGHRNEVTWDPAIVRFTLAGIQYAMGDLKAGKYLVRAQIGGLNYLRHVTVEDGKLAFVLFGGP